MYKRQNYRLPALNDQYWQQGGNSQIKPEYAWNIELGGLFEKRFNRSFVKLDLNVFSSWVENWILWSPQSNGLWEAGNVHRVWNKGGHVKTDIGGQLGNLDWRLSFNYTLAMPDQFENIDEQQNGKRIIYSPDHILQSNVHVTFKQLDCIVSHQIVSSRFLDSYNSASLPLYHVGSIECRYEWNKKRWRAALWVRLNNAYGHSYQIVSLRPMPLQIFQSGIQLSIE